MPYKSEAQRRKFHALLAKGEISASTVKEWDRASKGKKLPERVKKAMGQNPLEGLEGMDGVDPAILAAMTAGLTGVHGVMGATRALVGDRGGERKGMAEGLAGKQRGLLRRVFEHLADPSNAAAHSKGLELAKQLDPADRQKLIEKMTESYGPGSKVIRTLKLLASPASIAAAPITAPMNAFLRMMRNNRFDSAMAGEPGSATMARPIPRAALGALAGMSAMVDGGMINEFSQQALQGNQLGHRAAETIGPRKKTANFSEHQMNKCGAFERIYFNARPSQSPKELADRLTLFTHVANNDKTAAEHSADITDEQLNLALMKRAETLTRGEQLIYRFAPSDVFAQG